MAETLPHPGDGIDRRGFLKASLTAAGAAMASRPAHAARTDGDGFVVLDDFDRPDGYYHGDGWESLNPGYWMIRRQALRRRLEHRGDQRPGHWFPWHWETHRDRPMPTEYDPSLPFGMIWRRDWRLHGNYTIRIEATVRKLNPDAIDAPRWKFQTPGYALMGICFGGLCLHESWEGGGKSGEAAWMAAWRDDNRFGIYDHATDEPEPVRKNRAETTAPRPRPDEPVTIEVTVSGEDPNTARVTASIRADASAATVTIDNVNRRKFTDGYFGLVARGHLDFEVNRVLLAPDADNHALNVPLNELHVCYALGDSLRKVNDRWTCRFMAICRNDGGKIDIRIADSAEPSAGWERVKIAGVGNVVTNDFRRHTAVIDTVLPADPAKTMLYYTVWKDGVNVTGDPRLGTDAVGPGTGFLGLTPESGHYVGRLPRLTAPYRLCGLSCHAVVGNRPALPDAAKYRAWWIHDQPTRDAWRHLDDFGFQVMMWEDDVWYLELIFPPPSVDDAYKVITTTLGGPTTRWQMMRHWNVINPGDHDHGMDDVKGPEQIILRNVAGLGQDPDYLGRNFQIVSHLIRGEEDPSPTDNPKRWRRWKMPDGDFSLLIVDSRLWRSSQDTHVWDDQGWSDDRDLYDRRDPTRSMLGEEQFAWLYQIIRTDSSPLICLTGINGLHTIWTGVKEDPATGVKFAQRDRVAADYAGWVAAGVDRVLAVLGSRTGVVSVYGDVHNGSILKNIRHRIHECSFGPIGRYGGRSVIPGFGPMMKDFDGRALEMIALYHAKYQSPRFEPIAGPRYWNFLDMTFDPRGREPTIGLTIRNMVDAPDTPPRGGGHVATTAAQTGRAPISRLPEIRTLPDADVQLATTDGTPIRGLRSLADGTLPPTGLSDVAPNSPIIVTAHKAEVVEAKMVTTLPFR